MGHHLSAGCCGAFSVLHQSGGYLQDQETIRLKSGEAKALIGIRLLTKKPLWKESKLKWLGL